MNLSPAEKIRLADVILEFFGDSPTVGNPNMIHIGNLNRPQGVIGFKPMKAGDPVFDTGSRYSIVQESLDGKSSAQINYYKTPEFEACIDFFPEHKPQ